VKEFKFKIDNAISLPSSISNGIEAISFHKAKHGQIDILYLHLCNGQTLKIEADINTVSSSSWYEIGTLKFKIGKYADSKENLNLLNENWKKIKSFEVLQLIDPDDEGGLLAESGFVITNCINEELIIVCGAYPMTIQINAPFYNDDFEPEYDLIDYKREAYN